MRASCVVRWVSASTGIVSRASEARPGTPVESAWKPTGVPDRRRTAELWATSGTRAEMLSFVSERPGKDATVDQQVLPGDEAGVGRAQEGAGGAELVGVAEPLGRDRGFALGLRFLDADAELL